MTEEREREIRETARKLHALLPTADEDRRDLLAALDEARAERDALRLVVHSLRTLACLDPSEARQRALGLARAPSSSGYLLPPTALLRHDAPWLYARLDTSK